MCYVSVIHTGYSAHSRKLDLSLFSCSLSCIQASVSVDSLSRSVAGRKTENVQSRTACS